MLAQLFQYGWIYVPPQNFSMKRIYYTMAVLLMFSWMIGFFFLNAGAMIHTLAVTAVIFYLQGIITTPKPKIEQS